MNTPTLTDLSFEHFSHMGNFRKENQDCLTSNGGLFVIADGMGGLNCGRQAATIACETIANNRERLQKYNELSIDILDDLFQTVNSELKRQITNSNFGTTASLLFISNNSFVTGSIGDTRIYLLRSGVAFQITEDQNLANENSGSYGKNILTNYLGDSALKGCSYNSGTLDEDDIFLLCTDGFYENYDVVTMAREFKINQEKFSISNIEKEVIEKNPKDNYSCALVRVGHCTSSSLKNTP